MSLIFVYGNLKKGFDQHTRHMNGARYVMATETADPAYRIMAVLDTDASGPYPALLADGNMRVKGEVYEIDERLMMRLDAYEGHGYERRKIKLKDDMVAQFYFFLNPDRLPMTAEHPQIHICEETPGAVEWTVPS